MNVTVCTRYSHFNDFFYFYTHTILDYLLLIKRGTPAVLYREELLHLISNKLTKVVWV